MLILEKEGVGILDLSSLHDISVGPKSVTPPEIVSTILTPGFLTGDAMLARLGKSLKSEGTEVFYSGILLNWGLISIQMNYLEQTLFKATHRGTEWVDLIGHSLGGVYNRYLTEKYPHLVRKYISMGTPHTTHPHLAAHHWIQPLTYFYLYDDLGVFKRKPQLPEGIEYHSIYTPDDEVVDYRTCLDPRFNLHQVSGSHIGLPDNPQVQRKVKEILLS